MLSLTLALAIFAVAAAVTDAAAVEAATVEAAARSAECLLRAPGLSEAARQQLLKHSSRDSSQPYDGGALEAHHRALLAATRRYREGVPVHSWAGYRGPWIENHFIARFGALPQRAFGPLVPLFVQWTDLHVYEISTPQEKRNASIPAYGRLHLEIAALLRPDVLYVTVTQDDEGLGALTRLRPNVLSISAGGYGHIAIPLVKGELPLVPVPPKWSAAVGFYGQVRPRLARAGMLAELGQQLKGLKVPTTSHPTEEWAAAIAGTALNLAPRGFGRTSFRVAEIVQIGRVPVYIWDDAPWLPYAEGGGGNGSFSSFGLSSPRSALPQLARRMQHLLQPEGRQELEALLLNAAAARPLYTYDGVLHQLELFFAQPLRPGGGLLRCVRLPNKPH